MKMFSTLHIPITSFSVGTESRSNALIWVLKTDRLSEYVKICSLYGAGFYYMPGTDMCIKIGGYVRAEITDYSNGNMTQGPVQGNINSRATSNFTMRARAYITADAREQTAYGTARAYIAVGIATADIGQTLLP